MTSSRVGQNVDLRLRRGSNERDLWRRVVILLEFWLKELSRCSDGVCDGDGE